MKNNWIKVSDKLPSNENTVLVYTSDGCYIQAYYTCKYGNKWIFYDDPYYHVVTHWQPLEPPSE